MNVLMGIALPEGGASFQGKDADRQIKLETSISFHASSFMFMSHRK